MNTSIDAQNVQGRIYRIRGQQVMLDSDLALLYNVETKALKRAVRRNLQRFPPDFMLALTTNEQEILRRQIGTLEPGQHSKYLPYAFTQEGIAMLSGILRSRRAVQVNIAIMRAFVRLRHAVLSNRDVAQRVEKLEGKVEMHETDIRLILEDVRQLKKKSRPEGPIPPTII